MLKQRHFSLLLLIGQLTLLALHSVTISGNSSLGMLVILTLLLIAGVLVNKWQRKFIIVKALFVGINLIFTVLFYSNTNNDVIKVLYILSVLALLTTSLIIQFLTVLKAKLVDSSTIYSCISFYLLGGYTWATCSWLIETLYPGSFVINHPVTTHQLFDFVYFSFVTMATLGYGDIIPASEIAKTLALFISLFGQFYATIFLVIIVSKYIQQSLSRNTTASSAE